VNIEEPKIGTAPYTPWLPDTLSRVLMGIQMCYVCSRGQMLIMNKGLIEGSVVM